MRDSQTVEPMIDSHFVETTILQSVIFNEVNNCFDKGIKDFESIKYKINNPNIPDDLLKHVIIMVEIQRKLFSEEFKL